MNTYQHPGYRRSMDGHMKVFMDGELMGEWFKCKYKIEEGI